MSYISLTNQVIIEQEALALRACYTDQTEVIVELATTGSREMNNFPFLVDLVVHPPTVMYVCTVYIIGHPTSDVRTIL
jgi:hypothetical protein